MGRPRKSIDEHLRNGTYRPDRHGPLPVPVSPADAPAEKLVRPPSLTGRAAAVWDELAGLLGGIVRRKDIPALVELCRWIERSERIAATLDKLKPTEKEFKGLVVVAGIATDKVAVLTSRFGLSPADRAKIKAEIAAGPPKPKVPVRPATKLDKQGGPR